MGRPKTRILLYKVCKNCGKTFYTEVPNRLFCSTSCSSISSNKNRVLNKHSIVKCETCFKSIRITNSELKKLKKRNLKRHFCSKKCMGSGFKGDIRKNTSKSLIDSYKNGRSRPNKFKRCGYRPDINIYVRSGWEANFARILNYLRYDWLYEPEVFSFIINNKEITYRPDFYIPSKDLYFEVKGFWFNQLAKDKFYEFKKTHNAILVDKEMYKKLCIKFSNIINWEGFKYE